MIFFGAIGRFLSEQETGGVEIFDDAALLSLMKGSASGVGKSEGRRRWGSVVLPSGRTLTIRLRQF